MNFRLDRLATLYLASPCLRVMPDRTPSIPVLMYHSITTNQSSNVHPYYRTITSPAVFAEQMKFLHEQGYKTCTPAQAISQLKAETIRFPKSIVITFDDGYRNFYYHAFPVLKQYGFSATVYLPTAYIGETPIPFKGEDCLTWSEVRALKLQGIEFGSHTVHHPWLREMAPSAINDEIVNSKDTIEQQLGYKVDSFAYPYAFPQIDRNFTQALGEMLGSAGYTNGVSTIIGRANGRSHPLFLERLPINSCDDSALFRVKLAGAYDWVASSQRVVKGLKSALRPLLRRDKLYVSNDLPCRTAPHS